MTDQCDIHNFKTLANFGSRAGRFVSYLVANPEDRFSCDVAHLIAVTIDLVDLEGQITNLSGRTREYANELVTGRGTYILIRVESKCLW